MTKEAVYQPIEPAHSTPVVIASPNAPLSYQWFFTNGGASGATYNVTTVSGTNGELYYQWYKNTNRP